MSRDVTVDEVNAHPARRCRRRLAGILGFEDRPLVSADYTNDTRSGIVDGPSTMVIDGGWSRCSSGTTTSIGYVHRMAELAAKVAATRA